MLADGGPLFVTALLGGSSDAVGVLAIRGLAKVNRAQ